MTAPAPLRIGFVGSGFIAHFHVKSFESVRNAQITGVFSPTPDKRGALADAVNAAELGPCRAHDSLESLLCADDVDAIWLLSPNDTRLEVMRALNIAVKSRPVEDPRLGLREAARPHTGRSAGGAATGGGRRPRPRLPGEPGLRERCGARQGDRLAPRRTGLRPPLSGPRRPRSTPARTKPGSGGATGRAAA